MQAKSDQKQVIISEAQVDQDCPSISLGKKISNFGTSDFAVRFNMKTSETSTPFDILGNRVEGGHGNFFCVRMHGKNERSPEGSIVAEIDQDGHGTNYVIVYTQGGFNDGNWHYIEIVRQGLSFSIYVDGNLCNKAEGKKRTNIANSKEFRLGKSYSGFPDVTIQFKDLVIENGALTEGGEISPEFKQPIKGEIGINEIIPSISLGNKIGNFGTNDFSIAFFLKTQDNSRLFDVLGDRVEGSHGNFFCIRMAGKHESSPQGSISAEIDQDGHGTNYVAVRSQGGLNDGNWHHIAIVRQGFAFSLYVDGELSHRQEGKERTNISNSKDFVIGKSYSSFPNASLQFKNLFVFYKALGGDEIYALSN